LCQWLKMSAEEYQCQKRRIFLGFAIFVAHNERASKRQNFVTTQVQQSCNVDGTNKASRLCAVFQKWGWLEGGSLMAKNFDRVFPQLSARFPEDHRRRLLAEFDAYRTQLKMEVDDK
jgi:hypothetical protein